MNKVDILNGLSLIFGPLLTAGLKKVVPKVPTPVLPIFATGAGAAAHYIGTYAVGQEQNLLLSVLLGAAGIAVREVYDQVTKAVAPPTV